MDYDLSREVNYARWVSHEVGLMQGGLFEVDYARWVSHEVSYARWVSREVGYARYESPSEMFHSLIFYMVKAVNGMQIPAVKENNAITQNDAKRTLSCDFILLFQVGLSI